MLLESHFLPLTAVILLHQSKVLYNPAHVKVLAVARATCESEFFGVHLREMEIV